MKKLLPFLGAVACMLLSFANAWLAQREHGEILQVWYIIASVVFAFGTYGFIGKLVINEMN